MYHDLKAREQFQVALDDSPISFRPHLSAQPTWLFGFELVQATREDMAENLVANARYGLRRVVAFLNAHCVNVASSDTAYSDALLGADLLLPDGAGMRIAAKLVGQPMGENLNGTDLFPALCAQAASHGVSIYLLGGQSGVAAAAASEMQRRFPSLCIAGTRDGFFTASQTDRTIADINASEAGMLFVGMGVPQQDRWIADHADRLSTPVLLGVGGLFDYYSGRIPRAPSIVRRVGCEWAWRLAQEPRRLASRYLVGNVTFLARALAHALVARGVAERVSLAVKRAGDVLVASLAVLVALPILLVVALAIKLEDGGPVLFRQIRIGRNGRPFEMLKFRSMIVDAERRRQSLLHRSERDSVCFKMVRDPRITRAGRWLRRTSLDELPQIFNVLRGEMSLVGPRPALPIEVVTYTATSRARLGGLPGITGSWQVAGRAEIPFERQVEMDSRYLRERSLLLDLSLLARTVPAVLSGRGAY